MSEKQWIKKQTDDSERSIDRSEIMVAIEHADLVTALLTHFQRNANELVNAGANSTEIVNMRVQDLKNKILPTLPKQAMKVIEKWLADMTRKDLEKFKKSNGKGGSEQELFRYLLPFKMHTSKLIERPSDMQMRARVFLAAMMSDEYKKVMTLLYLLDCSPTTKKHKDMYSSVRPCVDEPQSFLSVKGKSEPFIFLAVACAVAIKARDPNTASILLEDVRKRENAESSENKTHDKLLKYYSRKMPKHSMKVIKIKDGSLKQFPGLGSLQVLAECNKVNHPEQGHGNFAFSKVIAVRKPEENTWYSLKQNEVIELFPTSGSVIHLEGKQFPHLPRQYSYAVWEVEEQPMSRDDAERYKTRVRVNRRVCSAHRVLNLEHIASSEHNLARQWLRNTHELSVEAEGERVLRFEDGLFIHTSSSYSNLVEEGFSQGLRSWKNLPMHDVGNGVYLYIGELPEESSEYHLALPEGHIGRKIRQLQQYTASEKDLFVKAISAMGLNHSINERLAGLDFDNIDFSDDTIRSIAELLTHSESFRDELNKQSMIHNKEAAGKLEEAERELARENKLLEQVNLLAKRKGDIIRKFESSLSDMEKDLREQMGNGAREFYEMLQMYTVAGNEELERRIEQLEQQIKEIRQ